MNPEKRKTGGRGGRLPRADVAVVGGGPAGITAAMAAAEAGLQVTLVESRGYVGGNLTIGLPVLGFLDRKGRPVVAGLAGKLVDRLRAKGAAGPHRTCPLHVSFTLIDPEEVKSTALEMLAERGVQVMLHASFTDAEMEGGRIEALVLESKSGREILPARVVVDATGDGDVAFRSGVPCRKGNEKGLMQPATLMFRMDGVDTERLRAALARHPEVYDADVAPPDYFERNQKFILVGLRKLIAKARTEGHTIPTDRTILITGLEEGRVWVNMTRVKGVDGTDARSLTAGEIEARRQVGAILKYLVSYVPGFEEARLAWTAPFLGVRETRRVAGRYVLTKEDILENRRFEDAVALGAYPIDLHDPEGEDCRLEWCDDFYQIPYRCLTPLNVENLLVAGRCVSATHEALASLRVMATCMALGEAAGRAGGICAREGKRPSDLDPEALREELIRRGACLEPS